jgi:hypothetical protein
MKAKNTEFSILKNSMSEGLSKKDGEINGLMNKVDELQQQIADREQKD